MPTVEAIRTISQPIKSFDKEIQILLDLGYQPLGNTETTTIDDVGIFVLSMVKYKKEYKPMLPKRNKD